MNTINISDIQLLCKDGKIIWKEHAIKRLKERKIKTLDVENCIFTGQIIEEYPTDYPAPSCLICGMSICGYYLHVVCSIFENTLCIITAYYPNLIEWESDYKIRKAVK